MRLNLRNRTKKTYPALTGALARSMLSGVNALTYISVMAKYCGDNNSSSMVIGADVSNENWSLFNENAQIHKAKKELIKIKIN